MIRKAGGRVRIPEGGEENYCGEPDRKGKQVVSRCAEAERKGVCKCNARDTAIQLRKPGRRNQVRNVGKGKEPGARSREPILGSAITTVL